jgi:hypothetical protein
MIDKIKIKKMRDGEEIEVTVHSPKLRVLTEAYMDFQKGRIGYTQRVAAYMLEERDDVDFEEYRKFGTMLEDAEKMMEKAIKKEIDNYPLWTEWLQYVKGIGPVFASYLICFIGDPGKFDTVSKLWMYSGLGIVGTEAATYKKHGVKANIRLKSKLWNIAKSFLRNGDGYRTIYEEKRKAYERKHPKKIKDGQGKTRYNPAHMLRRAERKTTKIFLQHLWLIWRRLEGLPVTEPYPSAILGHSHIIPPVYDSEPEDGRRIA